MRATVARVSYESRQSPAASPATPNSNELQPRSSLHAAAQRSTVDACSVVRLVNRTFIFGRFGRVAPRLPEISTHAHTHTRARTHRGAPRVSKMSTHIRTHARTAPRGRRQTAESRGTTHQLLVCCSERGDPGLVPPAQRSTSVSAPSHWGALGAAHRGNERARGRRQSARSVRVHSHWVALGVAHRGGERRREVGAGRSRSPDDPVQRESGEPGRDGLCIRGRRPDDKHRRQQRGWSRRRRTAHCAATSGLRSLKAWCAPPCANRGKLVSEAVCRCAINNPPLTTIATLTLSPAPSCCLHNPQTRSWGLAHRASRTPGRGRVGSGPA